MAALRKLTRYLRFYEKKRGERRTGSPRLGHLGLTLFFAGMCLVGVCVLAIVFTVFAFPEVKVNRDFEAVECVVADARVNEDRENGQPVYRAEFQLEYTISGEPEKRTAWPAWDVNDPFTADKQAAQEDLSRLNRGEQITAWYDPKDPSRIVVRRGFTGFVWLMLLLPVLLIVAGFSGLGYGVLTSRTSPEYRSAMAKKAATWATAQQTVSTGEFPYVPHDHKLTDSPGTHLALRLPSSGVNGWSAVSLALGALGFNAMASVFLTLAVHSLLLGAADWLLIFVSLLCAAAGVWLVWICLYPLARSLNLGRTIIEISHHPLHPGERFSIFLAQFGRIRLRKLKVLLVCRERATYQQGTNTRSETRPVWRQEVFLRRKFAITPGEPLEVELETCVPPGAMHSFRAAQNEVQWLVVVQIAPRAARIIERTFPVVVYPSSPRTPA